MDNICRSCKTPLDISDDRNWRCGDTDCPEYRAPKVVSLQDLKSFDSLKIGVNQVLVEVRKVHPRWLDKVKGPATKLNLPIATIEILRKKGGRGRNRGSPPRVWMPKKKTGVPGEWWYWERKTASHLTGGPWREVSKYYVHKKTHRDKRFFPNTIGARERRGRPPTGISYRIRRSLHRSIANDMPLFLFFHNNKFRVKGPKKSVSINLPDLSHAIAELLFGVERVNGTITTGENPSRPRKEMSIYDAVKSESNPSSMDDMVSLFAKRGRNAGKISIYCKRLMANEELLPDEILDLSMLTWRTVVSRLIEWHTQYYYHYLK